MALRFRVKEKERERRREVLQTRREMSVITGIPKTVRKQAQLEQRI